MEMYNNFVLDILLVSRNPPFAKIRVLLTLGVLVVCLLRTCAGISPHGVAPTVDQ